jgi:hypothetical protein
VLGAASAAPPGTLLVLTPLAPLAAFRADAGGSAGELMLLEGTRVEVLFGAAPDSGSGEGGGGGGGGAPAWRAARCVACVDLLAASPPLAAALAPLLAPYGPWTLGWPPANGAAAHTHAHAHTPTSARASLWVALLHVHAPAAAAALLGGDVQRAATSSSAPPLPPWGSAGALRRGARLALAGAPFGALAPRHFAASVAAGGVANALPPPQAPAARVAAGGSSSADTHKHDHYPPPPPPAAFLLDARTLPGAEGGPVACGATGALVGVLLPPLRATGGAGGAEVRANDFAACVLHVRTRGDADARLCSRSQVPLMLSSDALAAALAAAGAQALPLLPPPASPPMPPPSSLQHHGGVSPDVIAAASRAVALVTVRGGGAWGSAVCVGPRRGLFLTVAHLLQPSAPSAGGAPAPWASSASARRRGSSGADAFDLGGADDANVHASLPPLPAGAVPDALVRLTGGDGAWRRARTVWVCRGPLDVALLRLVEEEEAHDEAPRLQEGHLLASLALPPARDARAHLEPGAPCVVIGHAQFAPAAALPPAAAAGVVARVLAPHRSASDAPSPSLAMLLTSAAVHAGASGGAVVGADGALLGLVTSNARAAGADAPLPSLNFSVAAPALAQLLAAVAAADAAGATAAQLTPGSGGPGAGAPRALLAACAALDAPDGDMAALWALQSPPPALYGEEGERVAPPARELPPAGGPRLAAYLAQLRDGESGAGVAPQAKSPLPLQHEQRRSRL